LRITPKETLVSVVGAAHEHKLFQMEANSLPPMLRPLARHDSVQLVLM